MSDQENLERQEAKAKKPGETLVGKVLFDRFEVLEVLGESAMALVLKAREVKTDRLVAIKTVTPSDPESVKRFAQEVQLHGSLKHANIVEAIDSLEATGGRTFFIMEFLSGMSLHRVLQTQTRLENEDELASILLQICDALAHAHQFGVLHRDLKPGNIFLLEQDNKLNVKVLDFGIAKPLGQQTGLTQAGYAVGSPLYMSPEQCRGHQVDFRSDVYSLGILAYEMTTGLLPYRGSNIMTVMAAHCDPDRKPQHLNTQVPELCRVDDLNDTIQTAMETDPAKRFQTINDFKKSVQKWHDAVKKEFLSTLVPGQPRNVQPDTKTAVADQVSRNAATSSTDSLPKVPSNEALHQKQDNGAADQLALQQPQAQLEEEQQQAQQQVEQQLQQKQMQKQMLEQQQMQPQQQHQQMQRQQMKPLPAPPPEPPPQEQQPAQEQQQQQQQQQEEEQQQQEQVQQAQERQEQLRREQLEQERQRQEQLQQDQQRQEQLQQEQRQQEQQQQEQQLQEQSQQEQQRQKQQQEQQRQEQQQEHLRQEQLQYEQQRRQEHPQEERKRQLLHGEETQPPQHASAPDAVPPPKLRAIPEPEGEENYGDDVPNKSGGSLENASSNSEQKSRLRNRLSIGDVDVDKPTAANKSKAVVIAVIVVMSLLLIAFLVLVKLVLQP